jgi:hypothetical protein
MAIKTQTRKYQTQWAAQFYAAAELTRKGYLVSFTLGNANDIDLLAVSPSGQHFAVDVKGQSTRNFWLIQRRKNRDDLYFILVYLPKDNEPPQFCIVENNEVMKRMDELKLHIISKGGQWTGKMEGINWTTAFDYKECWDRLPA